MILHATNFSTPAPGPFLTPASVFSAFTPIVQIHSGQLFAVDVTLSVAPDKPLDGAQVQHLLGHAAALLDHRPHRICLRLPNPILAPSDWIPTPIHRDGGHLMISMLGLPAGADEGAWARRLRGNGFELALDRFGIDARSLRLLHQNDLDYVIADDDHLADIDRHPRKRLIFSQIVSMAHMLGLKVIAAGLKTADELRVVRELGADFATGSIIATPESDLAEIRLCYPSVTELAIRDRPSRLLDRKWVTEQLDRSPPVPLDASMDLVFARFAQEPGQPILPVIDVQHQALGVIYEQRLRNYAYSAFGKELIANRSLGRNLRNFIDRCPVADLATPLDDMLALFSQDDDARGILITDQGRYAGFLSARSLIRAAHEKNLARARDENPLTRLPGNRQIDDHITDIIQGNRPALFAYIDFDNFKPFNDNYGFRHGDRAILLFSELMRKMAPPGSWFLGHIGGDDFFLSLTDPVLDHAIAQIRQLLAKFSADALSFYEIADRERGSILAPDRDGHPRNFPLLTASAVLVHLLPFNRYRTADMISTDIARHKKAAKSSPDKTVLVQLS